MLDREQPRRAPVGFALQRRWVVLGAALVVALGALIGVSALLGVLLYFGVHAIMGRVGIH